MVTASAWAWPGVRAMQACRAASEAASATALRAMMIRPVVIASARKMMSTSATGASSTAALPASFFSRFRRFTVRSWW